MIYVLIAIWYYQHSFCWYSASLFGRGAWITVPCRITGPCGLETALIARSMGPTWGPPGADRTQVGPMLAPRTLLSGSRLISFGWFRYKALQSPHTAAFYKHIKQILLLTKGISHTCPYIHALQVPIISMKKVLATWMVVDLGVIHRLNNRVQP